MTVKIRGLIPADVDAVVAFGLRAWEPVSASFERVLGSDIYQRMYPDWSSSQAQAIASVCRDKSMTVWVAEVDDRPVGYLVAALPDDGVSGEIDMIAVDPNHQGHGIGSALTAVAIDYTRSAGRTVAVVATGGDPGPAPARRTYEKAGFTGLPLVRYCQAL